MNSVPHLVIAVTGRQNPTAFGQNSSPLVNLLWGGINIASGSLLFRFADHQEYLNAPDSKAWQFPYAAGGLAQSVFAVLYTWFTIGMKEQKRI